MPITIAPGANGLSPEMAFRARLDALGATLLDSDWRGVSVRRRVVCADGHECSPRPANVLDGEGICWTCSIRYRRIKPSARAEKVFRDRLSELGATLLEIEWLGSAVPHRVICKSGHECSPRPDSVKQGQGICIVCAGKDPITAERDFKRKLEESGATLIEPVWLGSAKPHRVICAVGHECSPRPQNIKNGQGICRTCAGKDPVLSEARFHARLSDLGATLLESAWLGSAIPHRVICAAGHECSPRPNHVNAGHGICITCAGKDPVVAEASFHKRLTELGAILLEPIWLGCVNRHRVICAAGHECLPRPIAVQRGEGICRICAGRIWDALYVVTSADSVKFGITSGDPESRLYRHRCDGFTEVIRLFTNLPGNTAPDIERDILATLKLSGELPVRGREYHDISALAIVLDVVDNHPSLKDIGAVIHL
jgi:formylmethanofuran dehydrogenase subunit E